MNTNHGRGRAVDWRGVDWEESDLEIADTIGCGVSTVRNKRHDLGLPPNNSGGKRNRKSMRIDWLPVNWEMPDRSIAASLGVSRGMVRRMRKILCKPYMKPQPPRPHKCKKKKIISHIPDDAEENCLPDTLHKRAKQLTQAENHVDAHRMESAAQYLEQYRDETVPQLREKLDIAMAKLSERKTIHEWLNKLGIPREELGKAICLLRRLRIACDQLHDFKFAS